MATRDGIIEKVTQLVGTARQERGVAPVSDYVDLALDEFSAFAQPQDVEQTITGDGTDEYAISASWVEGFSSIKSVHYWPSNDTNEEPQLIAPDRYVVENRLPSAGGTQIRFDFSPTSSDRVVVTFSAPHTVGDTAGATTVRDSATLGLAYLAASLLCAAAASSLAATVPQAGDEDATFGAGFGTAGDAYRRMSEHFGRRADSLLGINREARTESAGRIAVSSVRAVPGRQYGRTYLTHQRGSRWLG